MTDEKEAPAKKPDDLKDEQLDEVAGGGDINPQPLPPFRHMPN